MYTLIISHLTWDNVWYSDIFPEIYSNSSNSWRLFSFFSIFRANQLFLSYREFFSFRFEGMQKRCWILTQKIMFRRRIFCHETFKKLFDTQILWKVDVLGVSQTVICFTCLWGAIRQKCFNFFHSMKAEQERF